MILAVSALLYTTWHLRNSVHLGSLLCEDRFQDHRPTLYLLYSRDAPWKSQWRLSKRRPIGYSYSRWLPVTETNLFYRTCNMCALLRLNWKDCQRLCMFHAFHHILGLLFNKSWKILQFFTTLCHDNGKVSVWIVSYTPHPFIQFFVAQYLYWQSSIYEKKWVCTPKDRKVLLWPLFFSAVTLSWLCSLSRFSIMLLDFTNDMIALS